MNGKEKAPVGAGADSEDAAGVSVYPDDTTIAPGGQSPSIGEDHLRMLRQGSAISEAVILARGYRTVTNTGELIALGFAPRQRRAGLLLPLHTTDGQTPLCILRPDQPREVFDKKTGKSRIIKYEAPQGMGTRLDCPPGCRPMLPDPGIPLWVTEGQKKADSLASKGLCAIALLGVWNWRGRNDWGGATFLSDWDYVALNGRDVRVIFDSDVMLKAAVRLALDRLTEHLQRKGAHVTAVYLPSGPDGAKVGVDDYLAQGHTVEEVESLVEAPRPAPKAAPATVRLLDEAPATIRRPLSLINGISYAAIWPYCEVTETEATNSKGEVVILAQPRVSKGQRLFIVRGDGVIFGEGGDKPLDELGLDVILPEIPPTDKLWRLPAVKRYRAGYRPDPAEVFRRVVAVADAFIDFNRSLAEQKTMAELVACYILATWFLDAFTVVGFLWPNGDRGTGKTQLLHVVTQMGYLGMVILAGGSYASLRDLADYGACLGFDDAENLSDKKQTDPDKRALLLAGNRRGTVISVKELADDKTWRTRYVDAYCPRLFSAIKVPDPVLASRSIVVPLVRTGDKRKANNDPLDYTAWPHDRAALQDDLWALALANMPEIGRFAGDACAKTDLQGRNLEPWKAILTVALWLESRGVENLYERMSGLAASYQKERPDLETSDVTVLVIKALCHCATCATCAIKGETPPFFVSSSQISEELAKIAEEEEIDIAWMGEPASRTMRVGRILARLRFKQKPRAGGKGPREWEINGKDLEALRLSYGLPRESEKEAKQESIPF